MIEEQLNGLSLWFFENLQKHERISHFVSSRKGGFSRPPYESLNLGLTVGDDPKQVLRNRGLLASTLDISFTSLTFAQQIHDGEVRIVQEELGGRGATEQKTAIEATDAMVTNASNICLIVLLADCVPILLFDPKKNVVGAAHAGWRGTRQLVTQNTVRVFQERFGSLPGDIIVGIGPSIGPCCYEVGPEVAAQIEEASSGEKEHRKGHTSGGRKNFDLWETNKTQLVQMGIPEGNIESAELCTYCNHHLFFSQRYQKGKTGRFGAGIMIKGSEEGTKDPDTTCPKGNS